MTYIERNKKSLIRNAYVWTSIAFVLFFILFNYLFPHFIPALINSVVSPFWRLEYSIKNGSLDSVETLLNTNAILQQKLESYESKIAISSYMENENAEFRKILSIATSTKYIIAPIIKKPPFLAYDELIIDAGSNHRVSTSSIVYTTGEVPIGWVIDVFDNTSKVLLFSSPKVRHDVQVGKNNIGAVAVGRGGGQYEIELPKGVNIELDDYVVSLDIGNIPMGKVAYIDSNPSLTFEKILVSAPINIYELKWVKISIFNDDK